jgi:hypothetical protein
MPKRTTDEEKVASGIAKVVSDLRLDLDMIGRYLAWNIPNVSANRLVMIVEAMEYEKEIKNERERRNSLY